MSSHDDSPEQYIQIFHIHGYFLALCTYLGNEFRSRDAYVWNLPRYWGQLA